jgi:hypothetical protein
MGIFGIAKKGFGMLGKARAKKRMLSGTSTRSERLTHGVRDKTIKSVPVSRDVKKGDVKESIRKGRQHFYLKNIDEVNKHVKDIKKGEKAKKGLKQMRDTKRAFKIGKKKTFPSDPDKGSKEWGQQ